MKFTKSFPANANASAKAVQKLAMSAVVDYGVKNADEDLFELFSKTVSQCIENVDKDTDFAQYQYKETLTEQCEKTLMHLESLKQNE